MVIKDTFMIRKICTIGTIAEIIYTYSVFLLLSKKDRISK